MGRKNTSAGSPRERQADKITHQSPGAAPQSTPKPQNMKAPPPSGPPRGEEGLPPKPLRPSLDTSSPTMKKGKHGWWRNRSDEPQKRCEWPVGVPSTPADADMVKANASNQTPTSKESAAGHDSPGKQATEDHDTPSTPSPGSSDNTRTEGRSWTFIPNIDGTLHAGWTNYFDKNGRPLTNNGFLYSQLLAFVKCLPSIENPTVYLTQMPGVDLWVLRCSFCPRALNEAESRLGYLEASRKIKGNYAPFVCGSCRSRRPSPSPRPSRSPSWTKSASSTIEKLPEWRDTGLLGLVPRYRDTILKEYIRQVGSLDPQQNPLVFFTEVEIVEEEITKEVNGIVTSEDGKQTRGVIQEKMKMKTMRFHKPGVVGRSELLQRRAGANPEEQWLVYMHDWVAYLQDRARLLIALKDKGSGEAILCYLTVD